MSCNYCKTEAQLEHNYCAHCGNHLSNKSGLPSMCGHRDYHKTHSAWAKFCHKCGQDMHDENGLEAEALAPMI